MGSSIETAVVFTAIMLIITFLITGSENMAFDSVDKTRYGIRELAYMEEDGDICSTKDIGGADAVNTSPEKLCTLLSGISDNYRILYDAVGGL
ncbi:MAG: hypothetical protein J6X33_08600 [Clostridiales bacterium]|nr:hypothetical protein [Clostridiales bacterium]